MPRRTKEVCNGGLADGGGTGETAIWRDFPDGNFRVESFVTENSPTPKSANASGPKPRENPYVERTPPEVEEGAAGATADFGSAAREDAAAKRAASSLFGAPKGT